MGVAKGALWAAPLKSCQKRKSAHLGRFKGGQLKIHKPHVTTSVEVLKAVASHVRKSVSLRLRKTYLDEVKAG